MRKIPIKLLLGITISFLIINSFSKKVQAFQTDTNGITWYSIQELLDYKEEDDREEQAACDRNLECLQTLRTEKIANNQKYQALIALEYQQFVITSVNLEKNTFKILFFDEDMRAKRYNQPKRSTNLNLLYIAWLKGPKDITNFIADEDKYFNNEISGVHTIFAHRIKDDGEGWFTEKDQEVEYEIPSEENIKLDTSRTLHYKMTSDYSNMAGHTSYSKCAASAGKDLDIECRAMVSAEKGIEFFMFREPKPITEDITEDEPNTTEEPNSSENNTDEISFEENDDLEDDGYGSFSEDDSEPLVVQNNKEETFSIIAPETGHLTPEGEGYIAQMPWWIKLLSILGLVILIWWFFPVHFSGNKRKINKKSKKSS